MPQLEEIMFYDVYEEHSAPGEYDTPDGPVFRQLFERWVKEGRPDKYQFIRTHGDAANARLTPAADHLSLHVPPDVR